MPAPSRSTSYGKVATAAAALTAPTDVSSRIRRTGRLPASRLARLDTIDKTNGRQVYGADLKLPGMLNAAIVACPVFGGKLAKFDAGKVSGMRGVKNVVPVGDNAVAVVADTWWRAKKALDVLPIEWDFGPNAQGPASRYRRDAQGRPRRRAGRGGQRQGDAKAALAGAARRIEAVYATRTRTTRRWSR